jgi:glucose-6-phosphate isomerase
MSKAIQYQANAAISLIDRDKLDALAPELDKARQEVLDDIKLLDSPDSIPAEKKPLDSGFINLPEQLLQDAEKNGNQSLLSRIEECAKHLQSETDKILSLGIGGSYMGARALFEALCHPLHNELSSERRKQIPRIYFEGNNVDNDTVSAMLEHLQQGTSPKNAVDRWGLVVISKSGGTLETAVAFRIFREALESFYGENSPECKNLVVPVTGETGKLRDFSKQAGYERTFPIPDNVGGRFSVFTAVGLLPAAILGLDIRKLLQGAVDMTHQFQNESFGNNPVLDYTAISHLFEKELGMTTRILSTWGARLEATGLWYDQLLAESLGKNEQGAFPLTVVNTRDLHSRGQQHQEGIRDKLITNLRVLKPDSTPLTVPKVNDNQNQDQLNQIAGKTIPDILSAAFEGTNQAYAEVKRPTADIILPHLDEHVMGQLLQMFMLATVLEGRLININPYGQPGVESYKKNMTKILFQS